MCFGMMEMQDLLSAVRKASDVEEEKRVALTLARRLIVQSKHAEAIQVRLIFDSALQPDILAKQTKSIFLGEKMPESL